MSTQESHNGLLIGQVAHKSGVNVQTVRYYERRRLIRRDATRPSGYREFTQETIQTILFIKRAQKLGFNLADIEKLLWLNKNDSANRLKVREVAASKLEDTKTKIDSLIKMKMALEKLVCSCKSQKSTNKCRILETLTGNIKRGKPL
ncbi:MAG TPA: MerR family transcriptional regulator [candidate division Zixibacteria bacterium]|nr:MerR family transcriptional regulator [candidate division Zixibacteria bacterium]